MGWCHLRHLLHGRQHIGPHANDPAHPAAVHRLEADRRHLFNALQGATVRRQLLDRRREGDGVVGHRHDGFKLAGSRRGSRRGIDAAFRRADPFDASSRELPLGTGLRATRFGQFEEPILKARGSQIGDQHLHPSFPVNRKQNQFNTLRIAGVMPYLPVEKVIRVLCPLENIRCVLVLRPRNRLL